MNYYAQELKRIKGICFSNQVQIDIAVNTKRYIDTNYDKEINLDLLAHLQFSSKYHLIRVFKKYYGITPRQYLINKRIEKAKNLLKSGKSVSDTCHTIGFDSIHSFSNLFKAKTGVPPSLYRRATFDKSKRLNLASYCSFTHLKCQMMKIKIVSIPVRDQQKALDFYTNILGFVKKVDMPSK